MKHMLRPLTIPRALGVILGALVVIARVGSPAPSIALPNSQTPVSFRAMERVTRTLQRPAVDAVMELHENMAVRIDNALELIEEAKQLKISVAYRTIMPNYSTAFENFLDSPFGQAYIKERIERIKYAPAKFSLNSSRFKIEVPDPLVITADQLSLLESLHSEFAGTLGTLLNNPEGVFNPSTIAAVAQLTLNNTGSPAEAKNLLGQVTAQIDEIGRMVEVLNGVTNLGSGLVQSLNSLSQLDISSIGQLTPILENLTGFRNRLGGLLGGGVDQILSQITNFEGSLSSVISTLTGGGIGSILGITQGINSILGPLQSQLGSLTSQLPGLLNTQSLLNLVNIPFLSTAQGLLSNLTSGLTFNVAGIASSILGDLNISGDLVLLIQQLFSISGAEAFIMGQFGGILQSLTPLSSVLNGSLLGMIDSVLANSPLDLGDQINNLLDGPIGSVLSPDNALLQLAWAGESLFTGAVQGGLQQLLNKIDLPLPIGTFSVATARVSSALTITPEAAAFLSASAVSKGSVPKLVFGSKKRKATSQNFCSSITSSKKRSACIGKVNNDWVRFQAKLRNLSNSTATALKSKKVVEQIEKKAFGKKLSTILAAAVKKAEAVKIQP